MPKRITSEQAFWKWFTAHEDKLFNFEADRERIFDELSGQLNGVHADLVFEFGPCSEQREFVISAGGLLKAFPAVSALVAAAPKLDRWCITAFRPRRHPISGVKLGGKLIKPEDVEFSLLINGSTIGLWFFIPGFKEDDVTLKQIVYLMLDEALGEYDVETRVGLIRMWPFESSCTTNRYPLPELPTLFDQLVTRLSGPNLPN